MAAQATASRSAATDPHRLRRSLLLAPLALALARCTETDDRTETGDRPATAGAPTGVGASPWASWTKRPGAVFEGNYTASDPSIVRMSDRLLMIATDLEVSTGRTVLVAAESPDGLAWRLLDTGDPFAGLVLRGRDGAWDENLESPEIVRSSDGYLLYYCGYRDHGEPSKGFPASMGLATSRDGRRFTRIDNDPIMQPSPGWYDNDAVYSPTVLNAEGGMVMLYVGHAYTHHEQAGAGGVTLLAATSADGRHWNKRPDPVMRPGNRLDWMRDGAAEPALVEGPDGSFYLFITGLAGEQRSIGIARGSAPFGPWDIDATPIVTPSARGFDAGGVLAPFVIIETGRARMWFLGVDRQPRIRIGYAEAAWPIYNPSTSP